MDEKTYIEDEKRDNSNHRSPDSVNKTQFAAGFHKANNNLDYSDSLEGEVVQSNAHRR